MGFLNPFWPPRRDLKPAVPSTGSTKIFFFSTCGPATISNRLFYANTEVSLTSIQEKTDAESCTNTLAYHTKPQMTYAA